MASSGLSNLSPLEQLRTGRLSRRFTQLFAGLTLYGFSLALMFRSGWGMPPWGVLDTGIARLLGLELGTAVILVGGFLLLLWAPLRQWPGIGTIANAIWIGIATDVSLAMLPTMHSWVGQLAFVAAGVVLNALATAWYIGAQFGPGPRDGLMTGLHLRFGWSLRTTRLAIEAGVLLVGFLLGGSIGIGTVAYAVCIGPLLHRFLPYVVVDLRQHPAVRPEHAPASDAQLGAAGSNAQCT